MDTSASEFPARPAPPRPVATRIRQWVEWFGAGRLAVTAVSVVAVAVGGWLLVRTPRPPVEQTLPRATTGVGATEPPADASASPTPTTASDDEVVVHVAGAVSAPGVYRLPASARVDDAVAVAGGPLPGADGDAINRAAPVGDGTRIYVPLVGEAVVAAPGDAAVVVPAGPVNVNDASAEQLDELPGVGPSTAAAIVAHRQANGPFAAVDELADVRGIGPAKLDALRGLVTV